VSDVEITHLLEGVRAGDIRVEDEERSVVLSEDFTGKSERTSCERESKLGSYFRKTIQSSGKLTSSEGFSLDRESDSDLEIRKDRSV
jgi:hypothetical protein